MRKRSCSPTWEKSNQQPSCNLYRMGIFCWNNFVTDAFVNLWTDNSAAPNCLLYTESGWVVESISKDVLIPCKAVTVDIVRGTVGIIELPLASVPSPFFLVLHVFYCSILYRIRFSYVFLTLFLSRFFMSGVRYFSSTQKCL